VLTIGPSSTLHQITEHAMSEFRQNFATKEWVIIAPGRSQRPSDINAHDIPAKPAPSNSCPFCPGREQDTGEEVLRYGEESAWSLRAVRNKYSALDPSHSVERKYQGLFLQSDSYGAAEVIIESPEHGLQLQEMKVDVIERVLHAFRDRAQAIGSMPNVSIVMIFRNHGPLAGTSLAHPHSQIIASPIIPPHIRDPFQRAALHYDSFGSCVYCDMLREELRQSERIVETNEHFVAFCPYASRTPYELRIYPLRHCAAYVWISDEEVRSFASILRSSLRRIMIALGKPSYNFIIRSAPIGDEDVRYLHWYFLLIPKLSTSAGFEIGSGIYINSSMPEECAGILRDAAV
jgi:UDPglucose--hexose-1-phosphate uridylyltransferase